MTTTMPCTKVTHEDAWNYGYGDGTEIYRWQARFLPPDLGEWRRRIRLLAHALRAAMPCRSAMAVDVGSVRLFCIDGVIADTAQQAGVITGGFVDLWEYWPDDPFDPDAPEDYEHVFAGYSLERYPDLYPEVQAEGQTIRLYDYYQYWDQETMDAARPPSYTDGGAVAPPESYLWFGLNISGELGWGAKILWSLVSNAPEQAQAGWHCNIPHFNDELMKDGHNPLVIFAGMLEQAALRPDEDGMAELWHPAIRAMIAQAYGY